MYLELRGNTATPIVLAEFQTLAAIPYIFSAPAGGRISFDTTASTVCLTLVPHQENPLSTGFIRTGNSVSRYWQMLQLQHQEYILAPYLSALKNFRNCRLVSRFRCGCHGLHVDIGNLKPVEQKVGREQRFCLVCCSDTADDEHHFVLYCLHIVQSGCGIEESAATSENIEDTGQTQPEQ